MEAPATTPKPWLLFGALAFALPTAALTTTCLPAAAAIAAAGWLLACHGRHRLRRVGLAGLPTLLAALAPPPAPPIAAPTGPVHVTAVVHEVLRSPALGVTTLRLSPDGAALWLSVTGDVAVLPGDRVRALARGSPAPCPDRSPRLHGEADNVQVEPARPSLRRAVAALRRSCEQCLLTFVPGDAGAVVTTLVLGRGTRPDAAVAAAHRDTGLSHLLAVSGAHAAMLAHLLGLSTLRRGQRLRRGRFYTAAVLLVLATYAAIAGGEPPVLRAVLAYALAAAAVPLGRPCGLAIGLGMPALVTCLLAPQALLGPSFLLSYAAVLGLSLAPRPLPGSGWWPHLRASFVASFWAAAATAPLTLFWFGQLAPWTVLLTPLLAPLVAALLVGGLSLCLVAALLPGVAPGLGGLLGWLAQFYAGAVAAADDLPGTPIPAQVVPPGWWLVVTGTAAVAVLLRWPHRRGVLLALGLLCFPHFAPLHGTVTASFRLFAVGHGQAALFTTPRGERIAIDCGSMQHPQLAARRLIEALPTRWLDLLVVTHADQDHHNGVPLLLGPVHVARAVLPAGLAVGPLAAELHRRGVAVQVLAPGERLTPLPGLLVTAPDLPAAASDNDQSLWCRLLVANTSVLLTGDAEALGVAAALASGVAAPADLLVLPHHGRANPLGPRLLQRVAPRACFASAAGADGDTALGALARRGGGDLFVTGRVGNLELDAQGRVRCSESWRPLPPR